jgi:hypothetical protein
MKKFVALFCLIAFAAHGHEASEPEAAWFNSLRQPATGMECCQSTHDCREYDERTEVRIENGVYALLHRGEWLPVPEVRFIDRADNPTGHLVACVHDFGFGGGLWCSVP